MCTWPLNLNAGSAIVASLAVVEGGISTGELIRKVPAKLGVPVQLEPEWGTSLVEYQPGVPALTSIGSLALRPRVGLSQIAKASLVCIGPLMLSPLTKEIVSQYLPPPFGIWAV